MLIRILVFRVESASHYYMTGLYVLKLLWYFDFVVGSLESDPISLTVICIIDFGKKTNNKQWDPALC